MEACREPAAIRKPATGIYFEASPQTLSIQTLTPPKAGNLCIPTTVILSCASGEGNLAGDYPNPLSLIPAASS